MIRRLLLVDPICSKRAPTMRAMLVGAQQVLPELFDEVEIWSMENDLQGDWVKWRRFPKVTPFWPIQCMAFRFMAWRAYRRLTEDFRKNTLIQCSGEHLPGADIRYVQFWNIAYRRLAREKPGLIKARVIEKLLRDLAIAYEAKCVSKKLTAAWWCVSRGIADAIRFDTPDDTIFEFLPNSYDPERFNPEVRAKHRDQARERHGFSSDEIVFGFSSFGHFVRKGLLQAIQTMEILRDKGWPVRMLVLGGSDAAIAEFMTTLAHKGISAEKTVFAGQVDVIEEHLSGADAFLFPSHFEAFALSEIEAGALGLRLYLTAHPGSEMILREKTNGASIPWDVPGMASVIEADLENGIVGLPHTEMGEALTPETYVEQLRILYRKALDRKTCPPPQNSSI